MYLQLVRVAFWQNWRNVMRWRVIGWIIMLFPPLKTVATLELPASHTLLLSPNLRKLPVLASLSSRPLKPTVTYFPLTSVTHYHSRRHRAGHAAFPLTDPQIDP